MTVEVRNVVTGAFSYTGMYIARRLLATGEPVTALTDHPDRPHPFGDRVPARPFDFDRPDRLAASLRGATTLYNTYWVRFSRGETTYERAVRNTGTLIAAAEEAGVRRIVHVSIANPSLASPLPYFKGKAIMARMVRRSRLSWAIVRPTLVYGVEDILVNNMAWLLRRFPVFPVAAGDYRVQPVFAGDVGDLAVRAGHGTEDAVMDAAGPEVFTFADMATLLARAVGSRARVVPLPGPLVLAAAGAMGRLVRDVLLTPDELRGLTASLLVSREPSRAPTRLTQWLRDHGHELGRRYASELARHYDGEARAPRGADVHARPRGEAMR